jgi:hypothetical protein
MDEKGCFDNCNNGNGVCDQNSQKCVCKSGFYLDDCSMDSSTY